MVGRGPCSVRRAAAIGIELTYLPKMLDPTGVYAFFFIPCFGILALLSLACQLYALYASASIGYFYERLLAPVEPFKIGKHLLNKDKPTAKQILGNDYARAFESYQKEALSLGEKADTVARILVVFVFLYLMLVTAHVTTTSLCKNH